MKFIHDTFAFLVALVAIAGLIMMTGFFIGIGFGLFNRALHLGLSVIA